mmetsp:Transcript_5980/g.10174  ORF Transcript_5980/g.10174 Transcript_5980/m.10174 type:complete len:111 (+) Transcript_5980:219-551(+)|eukprot:CAMPEP_0168615716 /NCGR_PEP_ID=MMETSP0449_2-20121227/4648_1 /TAXON_ID=1082188 /ORGANISM="Strombidium rassoulzadegani, Strain ras09" /LENGTH=110 /DNA_ID=CAMNT_0008656465 /DNA_START=151 /DNA_END=483 /DNA_ORIENTATION=+
MKNPFKKRRGEGYVPPSQQQPESSEPPQSLATFSILNQKDPDQSDQNDAIVAGTFGGEGLGDNQFKKNKAEAKNQDFESQSKLSLVASSNNDNSYQNPVIPRGTTASIGA